MLAVHPLLTGITGLTFEQVVMMIIGSVMIWLAIKKQYEPMLLLPIGFGAILANIPQSAAVAESGFLTSLYNFGIGNELFPILIFIGVGAMIDFSPLLTQPVTIFFGGAAQLGIFVAMLLALCANFIQPELFSLKEAAAIGIIGAADGPTSIYVGKIFAPKYIAPITVAAYSYMALVPIIQPFAIKLVTTKKERRIRMPYNPKNVSRTLRICFPILVTIIAGFIAPMSVSLVGFLMFGNLLRECGCLDRLSETAQNTLANLITLLLGITISFSMRAEQFVNRNTLIIMGLGLVAFVFDSIAGVMFAKLLNLFSKKKVNPMVGAAGISAFPMSARVIQKMGIEADSQNHLLMHAVGANVAGQIASVLAGGMILNLVPQLLK